MPFHILICAFIFSFAGGGQTETIQCYCNLPTCLANNNTCQFENGGCFSDFLDYRDTSQARHGCLHLLDRERKEQCGNSPGSTGAARSLLLCCQADMCNNLLSPHSNLSHSIIGSLINATGRQLMTLGSHDSAGSSRSGSYQYNPHEVWFKAATIAVPICGAMILLMLVALAFKILRADNVRVEKYRKDANCNANSHIVSFNANELNPKDLSKKVPLLYETRHQDFRSVTSTRIHYGQNVNMLREQVERVDKNVENAKLNSERPRPEQGDVASGRVVDIEPSSATLDVREEPRVVPTINLNLEKPDWVNICNIYTSPAPTQAGASSSSSANANASEITVLPECDAVLPADKVYDKYLL